MLRTPNKYTPDIVRTVIFSFLSIIWFSSCALFNPNLIIWKEKDKTGAIISPLCGFCSEPTGIQKDAAELIMKNRCKGNFDVVEEGTRISEYSGAVILPVLGGNVVGQTFKKSKTWYYVFECR